MGDLHIRTSDGGLASGVDISDLGYTVESGLNWTVINSANPPSPWTASGQFTSVELRDSYNLYYEITTSGLEWSRDGITQEVPADYVADYMMMQDFSDDDFNLAAGRFTTPYTYGVPSSTSSRLGELAWDPSDDIMYVYTSSGWAQHGNLEYGSMPSRLDILYDEVNDYTYVGEALPGSLLSAADWSIYRLDETASGELNVELVKRYANGTSDFNKIWDDREIYIYG